MHRPGHRDIGFLGASISGAGGEAASDWANRVVANGGALPSSTIQNALATFYNGLVTAELSEKFYCLNCYAPGDIEAGITPLIVGVGNDPWTNGSGAFGDSHLTVDGLMNPDGTNRWLDTGVVLSSEVVSEDDLGATIYMSEGGNENSADFGANNGAFTEAFVIETALASTNSLLAAFSPASNSLAYANSGYLGYLSFNRQSSTVISAYQANSGTAHALKASQTTTKIVSLPSGLSAFFHATNFNGTAGANSHRRISFGAIHTALDIDQSEALFDLVQQLRVDLGGGYI